jgi:phosphatidylglycerol lysyltransferase
MDAIMSLEVNTPRVVSYDDDMVEECAYQFGRSYDSYLGTEPGRQYFWSQARRGCASYVPWGRHWHVSGGLLAPDDHKETLLSELVAHAQRQKLSLSFYNIVHENVPLFLKFGFQRTKWGEEAIVDLEGCTWGGKPYEWVRRQTNFCRRHGLTVTECLRDKMTPAAWHKLMVELCHLAAAPLADKPQAAEIRFLDGQFDPRNLGRKRIFVARTQNTESRVEAFLACNPCEDGAKWVFEMYRHRADSVRGAMPFLMHQTMQILQAEGVRHVSLCLIPGRGCQQPLFDDSSLARRGLVLGSTYFSFIFDSPGMYHFKSRFRPRFEDRYICAWPKFTLSTAWTFVRVLGVLDVDVVKLIRVVGERVRQRATRANLADLDVDAA